MSIIMTQSTRTLLWMTSLLIVTSQYCDSSSDCPSSACDCSSRLIDCRYKGSENSKFTSVPQFRSSQIRYQELTLNGHDIKEINDEAFSGLMIDKLDLTSNPLHNISSKAFANIVNLEELRLTLDSGALFPSPALSTLEHLKILQIEGYGFGSLPSGNVFQGLIQLNTLILKNGQLTSLSPEVFQDQRNTLSSIDITSNMFTAVPTEALRSLINLTILRIDKNKIDRLESESFEGLSLRELRMSFYSNLMIDSQAFKPLRSTLKTLQMTSCQLQDESLQAIKSLRNLTHLDLSNNYLISNVDGLFNSLTQLDYINLAYNNIASITSRTFEGLTVLRILYLSENLLEDMDRSAFVPLTSLQQLFLDNVLGVSALDETSFRSQANSLQVLSLDKSLTTGQWPIISHLYNIKTLRISGCSLGNIPDYNFQHLNQLTTLVINNNNIDQINPYSLYGLHQSLERLDLNGNKLQSLDPCSLNTKDSKPIQLYLQNNPLKCDCSLFWLYEWLVINGKQNLAWTCADGRRVSDLNATDFRDCANSANYSCPDWAALFTTIAPPTIQLSIRNKSSTWIQLEWTVEGLQDFALGFRLTHQKAKGQVIISTHHDTYIRSIQIDSLLPNTLYKFCIYVEDSPYNLSNCLDTSTISDSINPTLEPEPQMQTLWLIVGGTAGAVLLLILLICCCVLRQRKSRRRHEVSLRYLKDPGVVAYTPQIGEGSKRFLKPRPPSQASEAPPSRAKSIADQLNSLSEDERYRLVNLLTNSGGSMASLPYLPSGSGYTNDSRFHTLPTDLRLHHYSLERRRAPLESHRHVYEEIEDEFYDEISIDDNI